MAKLSTTRHLPSVQQSYIRAREIMGEVLCLYAPLSPTKRAYCTMLDVSTINFLLKANEEQDALVERYHALLKSLNFPVQIIVRNQRLDLRPYLARVNAQIPARAVLQEEEAAPVVAALPGEEKSDQVWAGLAMGLGNLLQQIGSRRTLIERRCYLIIPAPDLVTSSRRFSLRRKRRRARNEELIGRALQELSIRVEMVQTQLAALGLRSHRLRGEDLARMYQSCLSPEHALHHPLQRLHLGSVGHLPQVKRQTASRSVMVYTPEPRAKVVNGSLAKQQATDGQSARHAHMRRKSQENQFKAMPPADFLRLADLLAPASITEERDALRIDDEYVRTLVVTAFPREVSTGGWLAPLLMLDEILDICIHLHPQNQAAMMRLLKRRRVGYASARSFNRHQGRLDDPDMDVAQNDVSRLMSQLASGGERMFEVSFLLVVRAPTKAASRRCYSS